MLLGHASVQTTERYLGTKQATGCAGAAVVTGIPDRRVERIALSAIDIAVEGGPRRLNLDRLPGDEDDDKREQFAPLPAYGFYARHVSELSLTDFHVHGAQPDPRIAMIVDDAQGVNLTGFRADAPRNDRPALWLNHVGGVTISGWNPAERRLLRVTDSPRGGVVMPVWREP